MKTIFMIIPFVKMIVNTGFEVICAEKGEKLGVGLPITVSRPFGGMLAAWRTRPIYTAKHVGAWIPNELVPDQESGDGAIGEQ